MVVVVRSSMTAGALNPLLSGGGRWPEARVTAFSLPGADRGRAAGRGTIMHKPRRTILPRA